LTRSRAYNANGVRETDAILAGTLMAGIVHFLRCVGRATVKNGIRALANLVPLGGAIYEIAVDAHEEYRKDRTEEDLRTDLEGLARTDAVEIRRAAEQIAAEEAAGQPEEVRLALASYLDQLPDSVRQSLFAPCDPGEVAPGVPPLTAPVLRPEDLLQLLPATVPVRATKVAIRGPKRTYLLHDRLAAGDVANIHLAETETETEETPFLLKVSRVSEGASVLDNEGRLLNRLLTVVGDTTYRKYLPPLVESFTEQERQRRVNVFRHDPGFYTLEQVHARHPALEGRHLAWIFKRLLTVLGFCHRQRIVHGAVLPPHVLLHAADHGLRLVGWGQAVSQGRRLTLISTRFREWYPSEVFRKQPAAAGTDLFLAARCLIYLAGGDVAADRMPDAVPTPMQRLLRSCLLEGHGMRPNDAWNLMDEFDGLLRRLYGPPKFVELKM
jgi:hypothetical protein